MLIWQNGQNCQKALKTAKNGRFGDFHHKFTILQPFFAICADIVFIVISFPCQNHCEPYFQTYFCHFQSYFYKKSQIHPNYSIIQWENLHVSGPIVINFGSDEKWRWNFLNNSRLWQIIHFLWKNLHNLQIWHINKILGPLLMV